jgi:hypothetical protein
MSGPQANAGIGDAQALPERTATNFVRTCAATSNEGVDALGGRYGYKF